MPSRSLQSFKGTWLFNIRADVLAGLVVALALIPEAIARSIIAGVDPKVGLYGSFCIAIVMAKHRGSDCHHRRLQPAARLLKIELPHLATACKFDCGHVAIGVHKSS